ncbi:MAG: hypothetical protein RL531_389 [Actinomycetota bacterium]
MPNDDPIAIYRGIRGRVADLVRDLDADTLDRIAPATPAWSVHDLLAHLIGDVTDIVEGNLDGVATDAWTQAQVDRRRGIPVADLLEEWEHGSAVIEPTIGDFPPMMRTMFLTDAVTHEHDIRHAIGAPGARDSDAIAYSYATAVVAAGLARGGAGAVRVVHEAGEDVVGDGSVTATLRTPRFEIVRAAVGRRSLDEIVAWDWEGEPTPDAFVLGMFTPTRETPLGE